MYTPTHSNYFYEQDEGFRRAFIKRNLLSSDGISECTLRSIYQQIYSLRFIERAPIEISLLPFREVRAITQDGERWLSPPAIWAPTSPRHWQPTW